MQIRWATGALGNLEQITAFIAKDKPLRAQSFAQELRQKIEGLRQFQPGKAGRIFGTKEYVLHANYIVIYRVKQQEVQILRIQHAAQNH